MTKHITLNFPCMRSGAFAMPNKHNLVLYLDRELVEKSKELGFNLSKTFENHLKQLITRYSCVSTQNNSNLTDNKMLMVRSPGFEPGSSTWQADVLNQARLRPLFHAFCWSRYPWR
jgi:hypothetical protein